LITKPLYSLDAVHRAIEPRQGRTKGKLLAGFKVPRATFERLAFRSFEAGCKRK
jgi:hypothetical protein